LRSVTLSPDCEECASSTIEIDLALLMGKKVIALPAR
jgi:hypothetical protein